MSCSIGNLSTLCPELPGHTGGGYCTQHQTSLHSSAYPYLAVLGSTLPLCCHCTSCTSPCLVLCPPPIYPVSLASQRLLEGNCLSAHEHLAPQSHPHGIQCALVLLSMLLEADMLLAPTDRHHQGGLLHKAKNGASALWPPTVSLA